MILAIIYLSWNTTFALEKIKLSKFIEYHFPLPSTCMSWLIEHVTIVAKLGQI